MPHASRPGDVLAGRYTLVDLLTESGGGRFWRAYDRVLERHVALHVIRDDDPRAPGLMAAARRSVAVLDPRVLRVLDADRADGVCYVVNEWGWGASLDVILAGSGPLGPRRAAWLVSEVAAVAATAHAAGVCHGRLVPENVLVDRGGGVRVIGLCVDAALHGLPPEREDVDVADLAGLLYCALTTLWPGPSDSAVPAAPREHDAPLRPRRVRAGVPRALDVLCEEVLHRRPGSRAARDQPELRSAQAVADHLTAFVGDPTGMPAALVAATPDVLPEEELVVLPPVPEMSVRPEPPADLPTQAGLPIFGDDDDVSWLERSTEPVAPPPPFDEPPERPLFAPEPAAGAPARQTRTPADADEAGTGDAPWPWDDAEPVMSSTTRRPRGRRRSVPARPAPTGGATTRVAPAVVPRGPSGSPRPLGEAGAAGETGETGADDTRPVPGRSFLRLAGALIAVVLVVVAVIVAVNLGRGRTALGGEPARPRASSAPTSGSPSTPAVADAALTGVTAGVLDPQGEDTTEHDDEAPLAVDGRATTAWTTLTYTQQLGPDGLKTGVGLVLDLGAPRTVSDVDLAFDGAPTTAALYLTADAPSDVAGLTPVATATAGATAVSLPIADVGGTGGAGATGRYLVVWLTSLPPADSGGYRGAVSEVVVRGH